MFFRFLYDVIEEEYLYYGLLDIFLLWILENLFVFFGVYEVSNIVDLDEFLGEFRFDIV